MMWALLGLALAAAEPPGPRPAGDVVALDAERLVMPAPLGLWYEQRHRYAGQLEAQVAHFEGRLELAAERTGVEALRVKACSEEVAHLRGQVQAVERADRFRGARDVALVGGGFVLALASVWAAGQLGG